MANQLKIGSIRPNIAPGYIGFYPSFQAAADLQMTDLSGKNNHAVFGADLTGSEAWSTLANHYSTPEDTTGTQANGAMLTMDASTYNPATESLFVFAKVRITAPGGTRPLFGTANSTPNAGFGLKFTAAGKARIDLHRPSADQIINTSSASIADGTSHSVALGIDRALGRVIIWIDGAQDVNFLAGNSIAAFTDWYPFTRAFAFGGAGHNGGKIVSGAQSSFGWHILKRTGGLPSNISTVAERLHRNPVTPLSATEWV